MARQQITEPIASISADAVRPRVRTRMDIDDTLVEDDRVAARVTSHLTHLESGREATITGLIPGGPALRT